MNKVKKPLALFFAILLFFTCALPAFAQENPSADPITDPVVDPVPDDPEPSPFLILSSTDRVVKGKTVTLQVNKEGAVTWQSSDNSVAAVDKSGTVTGNEIGTVTITATLNETKETAEFTLHVIGKKVFWRDLLEKKQIFGYRYSYVGDYYYTDDKDCWQKFFGFNFAYDIAAPLALIQYDYVRVFFTYGEYDWMIQMWKGQYGLLFHGSEVGVYTKPVGSPSATRYAHYAAADKENFLKMSTALYHQSGRNSDEYHFEFERPYDEYWWCTGFVPGHLRNTIGCKELRAETRITLKDEEMTRLFCEGLKLCGFTQVKGKDSIKADTFSCDGTDVYLQWQNITGAANHATQVSMWGAVGFTGFVLSLFMTLLMMLFFSLGGIGLLIFLI